MIEYPDPANVPWTAADRREVKQPRCALTREQYERRMAVLFERHGQIWVSEFLEAHQEYGVE